MTDAIYSLLVAHPARPGEKLKLYFAKKRDLWLCSDDLHDAGFEILESQTDGYAVFDAKEATASAEAFFNVH